MPLAELQRIKQWHIRRRHDHPLEYGLWDGMLTLWVAHRAHRLRCDWAR